MVTGKVEAICMKYANYPIGRKTESGRDLVVIDFYDKIVSFQTQCNLDNFHAMTVAYQLLMDRGAVESLGLSLDAQWGMAFDVDGFKFGRNTDGYKISNDEGGQVPLPPLFMMERWISEVSAWEPYCEGFECK